MKLRAENLIKTYKGRSVVKGISLEVNQGQIVGLLGPNGAGKTTSFYMIVGLVKPNSGHIYLDDLDITEYPMYKRAQQGVGYLAQEASVFRKLSIEDNILSVLQLTKERNLDSPTYYELYDGKSPHKKPCDNKALEEILKYGFELQKRTLHSRYIKFYDFYDKVRTSLNF